MFGMAFALFALALVVALLWLQVAALNARLTQLTSTAAARTPAAVTAAVEDLRTALAQVNATNRREFGAIWKRLGLARQVNVAENELPAANAPAANDDSFAAMLALQSAPPVKPQ